MKYVIDHDLHIHTNLSPCSRCPEQMPDSIFKYAKEEGYSSICVTDHFWDSDVEGVPYDYRNLNQALLSTLKPLPQNEKIKFMFGCEAEINTTLTLGISAKNADLFDFIIIPTTHLHMHGISVNEEDVSTFEGRANQWIKRFEIVLDSDLPLHKVGIAHLACNLIAPRPYNEEDIVKVLNTVPTSEMERLFERAAKAGVGIEINACDMGFSEEYEDAILRPFKIAKECGCRFYLGSDAHAPGKNKIIRERFQRGIDILGLEETDKFHVGK